MKLSVYLGVIGALSVVAEAAYTANPTALILAATAFVGARAMPMYSKVYDPDGHVVCAEDIPGGCVTKPNMDKLPAGADFAMVGADKYSVICVNQRFNALLKTDALHPAVANILEGMSDKEAAALSEVFQAVCTADKPKEALEAAAHEYDKMAATGFTMVKLFEAGLSGKDMSTDKDMEWAMHLLHEESHDCCAAEL